MFLSVKDLRVRKIGFETAISPGEIDFLDADVRLRGDLRVKGLAELRPPLDEIRVHGRVTGSVESDCDRCLEPVVLDASSEFDLAYLPVGWEPASEETEISEEDSETGFYEGDGIELNDVIREQILLSMPLRKVCSEGCKGICPVCGQNRNVRDCGCSAAPVDDRWAALKNFGGH